MFTNDRQRTLCVFAAAIFGAAALTLGPVATTLGPDLMTNADGAIEAQRCAAEWIARFERVVSVDAPSAVACGLL